MASPNDVSNSDKVKALDHNRRGLEFYEQWEIEKAIAAFEKAVELNPQVPDYSLNLARAYARYGDYENVLKALGYFLRVEKDQDLVERFESFFGSKLDGVEKTLTRVSAQHGLPLEVIGAAIQMWLEYRIAIGRRPLLVHYPEAWAAALDFTVRKINFREVDSDKIAGWYRTSADIVRQRHLDLVETLDLMPCDYRYFRGTQNPLDKLVEAATLLEKLEARFRQF